MIGKNTGSNKLYYIGEEKTIANFGVFNNFCMYSLNFFCFFSSEV